MRKHYHLFVRSCKQCSREKKSSVKARAQLGSYQAGAPVERFHIDILGLFPKSRRGNRYILMLICQFTKWIEGYPLADQTAEQVVQTVVDNFISRFGIPQMIHSDQGANFTSALFQHVCDLLEITKTRTSPYRPCSNSQVERYNRTLLQFMHCHLKDNSRWDEHLPALTSAIRSVPNMQTGFTPNLMMLGCVVSHPARLLVEDTSASSAGLSEYFIELRDRMRTIHLQVRDRLEVTQRLQKSCYDMQLRQTCYAVGDVVLRRNDTSKKGHSNKLKPSWVGPLLVDEVVTPVVCRVQGQKKTKVLHHDLLKRCFDQRLRRARKNLDSPAVASQESDPLLDNVVEVIPSCNLAAAGLRDDVRDE